MAAGPQHGQQHRVGDRYYAEVEDPKLTLVVSCNVYQRWTVVIVDRNADGAVLDTHEAATLADAQRYAEGFAQARSAGPTQRLHWTAQPAG